MKIRISLLLLFFTFILNAQNREHAFEVNKKLGRGINYGNMFEAPAETEWGNPWKPNYAKIISDLGFNHIRIPIRWEPSARSAATAPYTVNPTFLNRIKQVVDSALSNNLHAIINMHHHEALYENPDQQKARFLAQWRQISEFFKDYPDSLLFEIMNEPHGNLTPEKWNIFFADAIQTIREDNPDRIIVIGTAEYGGLGGLPELQIPDDQNIIVTVHYYNPFQFTHQGAGWVGNGTEANAWLGTKWDDSETEREIVQNEFAPLVQFGKSNNVPIHIGEFGAYNKADEKSRGKWTTYIARYLESLDWSWAYWEFSAGFGIYNPTTQKFNPALVDALLHNEMPEPAKYVGTSVYTSNLSTSNDGWNLNRHAGVASFSRSNNALNVAISDGGTEGWHLQLVRNNIPLKEGKKYRISFKAKAESDRSATVYMGMNKDPWSAYSGYFGFSLSDTFAIYTFVFDAQITDNYARMVLDIGKSAADFTISDIKIEDIILMPPTGAKTFNNYKSTVYPNPATNKIIINNLDKFEGFSIYNLQGKLMQNGILFGNSNKIDVSALQKGLYLVSLQGKSAVKIVKIQKQ